MDHWQVILRQAFLGLGFGTTALFYVRWLNDWFAFHEREELWLKRTSMDFRRASWVVETTLEWSEEKSGPFPAALLEKFSQNLFVLDEQKPPSLHPADQLASAILGSSAKATFNVPGGQVELDRKSMNKLNRDPQNGTGS